MAEIDKVEYAAMHGDQMPSGLDVFDQLRFHGLSFIYNNYRARVVSKEDSSAYKRSLLREIELVKRGYEFGIKCYDSAAKRYKATEAAMNAYRLDRTLENADRLVGVIDGFIGEEGTQ